MRHTSIPLLTAVVIATPAFSQKQENAGRLQATEWANDTLLGSPVAIHIDHQGHAYAVQTVRRKESELDIRSHRDWVTPTLAMESVAEREAFYRRVMSSEMSERNKSWLKDRNGDGISDFRDLAVLSEKILRIEDKDGNGRADTSTVFVDGLNDAMTGVAAGVLSHQGNIYVTAIPRLWRFDANRQPGPADFKKEIMFEGFGVHIAYSGHDMHGLTVGPDGRIYWSIGDKGLNVTDDQGKNHKVAHEGAVLRCEMDGSGFEVFARGLRNPQEIAFDQWGNLFTVDNDGDFKGERERFVYISENSDSGWRCNWQYRGGGYNPWMDEKLYMPSWQGQAAYITPPLSNYSDGPSGFAYNPGSALGDEWKDTFFVTQFPGRKLSAFQVEPAGAGFRMVNERLAHSGPMMTGLSFGPDGALYVADWNSAGWDPHDKGKIWKLDVDEKARNLKRTETQVLLRDGLTKKGKDELITLLGHDDQRVRLEAQFALVEKGAGQELLSHAIEPGDVKGRIHAIWGLGQLGRRNAFPLTGIMSLLHDKEAEVRAQTAKVLGDARIGAAAPHLKNALEDLEPRVCFHAAMALAKVGTLAELPAIVQMLSTRATNDRFLRHAGIAALAGCAAKTPESLARLYDHKNTTVRISAVVALRRLHAKEVAGFLKDVDPLVAAEAARAIHDDDSIPAVLPELAASLTVAKTHDPVLIRRAISANLRMGGSGAAQTLARYATMASAPESMRSEALETLVTWCEPEPLDRVEGRYRPLEKRTIGELQMALSRTVDLLLGDASAKIRELSCHLVRVAQYQRASDMLHRLVAEEKQPASVRKAALETLAAGQNRDLPRASAIALGSNDAGLRSCALQLLARSGGASDSVVPLIEDVLQKGKPAEMQDAYGTLGGIKSPAAVQLLQSWMKKLSSGQVPEAARLDLLEAARLQNDVSLNGSIADYEKSKLPADKLAAFRETLQGGNAERGKHIALQHLAAQCTRCHKVGGEGAEVGPDLSKIGKRMNREQLLEAVVLPNATIAKGYDLIMITCKDGKTFSGSVEKENARELQLRGADQSLTTIALDQISQRTTPVSMMPPMDTMLQKRELRDLIEYLTTLK